MFSYSAKYCQRARPLIYSFSPLGLRMISPQSPFVWTRVFSERARASFTSTPRHRLRPLEWAATQNNLGTALVKLGERESGTEMLQKAIEAYDGALKEWTNEAAPY